MIVHIEEVKLAQAYEGQLAFEQLTRDQLHTIMSRGRELYRWFKEHHRTHCLINLTVLALLFAADYLVLMSLPEIWLATGGKNGLGTVVLAGVVSGALHCWLMYSLGVFSIHEGAAHKIIFPPRGPASRFAQFIASNLCRVMGGEPIYYSSQHMIHHSKFGTQDDAEFLNFVMPRRYWMTFLPLALILNFSDFVVHRPSHYTWNRIVSVMVAAAYQGGYMYLTYRRWGMAFSIIVLFFSAHVGFYLDRLRQFTEHNLMPLDNFNGSRSFGLGFWGMLVGGGPWGSPCHWEHHLVASIPWYQQILLHRRVVRLLTPRQRQQFLIEPAIGFPRLWWRLVRDSYSFIRASRTPSLTHVQKEIRASDST